MTKDRLLAFSDGVIAIIITIMVLELRPPEGHELADLLPLFLIFLSYILSFLYVAIYWNNHHHLLYLVKKIDGRIMWANMFLLFSLSLVPFATAWLGESHFGKAPMLLYGVTLLLPAITYNVLQKTIFTIDNPHHELLKQVQGGKKERLSIAFYALGIVLSIPLPLVAFMLYSIVALMWAAPDKRIESLLSQVSDE